MRVGPGAILRKHTNKSPLICSSRLTHACTEQLLPAATMTWKPQTHKSLLSITSPSRFARFRTDVVGQGLDSLSPIVLLCADNLEVEWDAGMCAVPDGLVRSSSIGRRTQALNPGFSQEGGIRAYDATGAPSITTSCGGVRMSPWSLWWDYLTL